MLQRAKLRVLELGWEPQSSGSCGVDSVQLFITLLRISRHCSFQLKLLGKKKRNQEFQFKKIKRDISAKFGILQKGVNVENFETAHFSVFRMERDIFVFYLTV